MSTQTQRTIKIIAGTLAVVALAISFLQQWNSPSALVTEDSPSFPDWASWSSWALTAIGTLVYFGIDLLEWRHSRTSVPSASASPTVEEALPTPESHTGKDGVA